jgi:raffinose/stachyose/melibiose transport system permease protein
MTSKQKNKRNILYVFLAIVAVLEISPLIITLLNSLRTNSEIKTAAIGFPLHPQFFNYIKAWNIGGYAGAFLNSMIISCTTSCIVLAASIFSGYFLARIKCRFTRLLHVYYGFSLSIPVFSFLVPLYFNFSRMNLVNSRLGIILIYTATNLPFNIILAATFISEIPRTLDEAAIIDGCSTYELIWKIIFPLAKPVITTILLIVFVSTWNEFTLANTFLQLPEIKTAATKYVFFVGERGSDLSLIYSAGIITMIPIVGIFLLLQNYFIDGLTTGSIK